VKRIAVVKKNNISFSNPNVDQELSRSDKSRRSVPDGSCFFFLLRPEPVFLPAVRPPFHPVVQRRPACRFCSSGRLSSDSLSDSEDSYESRNHCLTSPAPNRACHQWAVHSIPFPYGGKQRQVQVDLDLRMRSAHDAFGPPKQKTLVNAHRPNPEIHDDIARALKRSGGPPPPWQIFRSSSNATVSLSADAIRALEQHGGCAASTKATQTQKKPYLLHDVCATVPANGNSRADHYGPRVDGRPLGY